MGGCGGVKGRGLIGVRPSTEEGVCMNCPRGGAGGGGGAAGGQANDEGNEGAMGGGGGGGGGVGVDIIGAGEGGTDLSVL